MTRSIKRVFSVAFVVAIVVVISINAMAATVFGIVTANNVNFRTSPSTTSGSVIGLVHSGDGFYSNNYSGGAWVNATMMSGNVYNASNLPNTGYLLVQYTNL